MDLEVAMLPAKDGNAQALVNAMNNGGSAALLTCPGCHSVKALPGVESPGKVLLLIEWDSAAAHDAAKTSDGFAAFIKAAGPFMSPDGGGTMEHFRIG